MMDYAHVTGVYNAEEIISASPLIENNSNNCNGYIKRSSSGMIYTDNSRDASSTDSRSSLESKEENISISSCESYYSSENVNDYITTNDNQFREIPLSTADKNSLYSRVIKLRSDNLTSNQNSKNELDLNVIPEPIINQYQSLPDENAGRSLRKSERIDAKLRHFDKADIFDNSNKKEIFGEINKMEVNDIENDMQIKENESTFLRKEDQVQYKDNNSYIKDVKPPDINVSEPLETENDIKLAQNETIIEEELSGHYLTEAEITKNVAQGNNKTNEMFILNENNDDSKANIIDTNDLTSINHYKDDEIKDHVKHENKTIKFIFQSQKDQNISLINIETKCSNSNEFSRFNITEMSNNKHNFSAATIKSDDFTKKQGSLNSTPKSIERSNSIHLPSTENVSLKLENQKTTVTGDQLFTDTNLEHSRKIESNQNNFVQSSLESSFEVNTSTNLNPTEQNDFHYTYFSKDPFNENSDNSSIMLATDESQDNIDELKKKVDSVRYYWSALEQGDADCSSLEIQNYPNEECVNSKVPDQQNFVRIVDSVRKKNCASTDNEDFPSIDPPQVISLTKEIISKENLNQSESDLDQDNRNIKDANTEPENKEVNEQNNIDLHEFDHVRYKVIKSNAFRNSIIDEYKKAKINDIVQYLQDYSFQELLINNSVVIIEPVRTKIESNGNVNAKSSNGTKKSSSVSNLKNTFAISGSNKHPDCNNKSRRHFYYHPIRINRELIDEELPDPDTVRNVRRLFENVLQMRSPQISSGDSIKSSNLPTAVTSSARTTTKWDSMSMSSEDLSNFCDRDDQPRSTSSKEEFESRLSPSNISTKHYVSRDILQRIRECGTSVTYYGGM